MRSDIFILYKENIDRELRRLAHVVDEIEDKAANLPAVEKMATSDGLKTVEGRVAGLEDNQKWIVRLVIGFVIMGILAAVIVFGKPAGSP